MNRNMQVHLFATFLKSNKVNWLMTKRLSVQGRPDPRGGFVVLHVQTKLEPLLFVYLAHSKSSEKE